MKFEEKTLNNQSIYKGNITEYTVQEVELPNGNKATREIVRHGDAAGIIAIEDGKLLCVKQYRKPIEQVSIEIPAGLVDDGEDNLKAAQRELEEETGYQAKDWSAVTSFYSSPGFTDEKLEIFRAADLFEVEDSLPADDDETLAVLKLTYEEAWEAYEDGVLSDSKTVFALFYWNLLRKTQNI